jgi:hypothetical protein
MPRKAVLKKQVVAKPESAKFLSSVPFESGFRFFTAVGNYTGITAISLDEFTTKLQMVPVESAQFHFERKDFQKWIMDTIKDLELAEKINGIVQGQSTEKLRKEILRIMQERTAELKRLSL